MSQQTSALAEIGIKLDAHAIRERLATSMRESDTLRRLLKIAERNEQSEIQQQRRRQHHAV